MAGSDKKKNGSVNPGLPDQKNEVGLRETIGETQVGTKTGESGSQVDAKTGRKKKKKRRGRLTGKQKAVRVIAGAAVIVLAAAGYRQYSMKASAPAGAAEAQKTAAVQRMDMVSSLSSSGSLSPKDTYNITSLVSGDVITADFEEGDQVTEGQVLYVIDASSVETELNTAQNSRRWRITAAIHTSPRRAVLLRHCT